MNCRGCGKPLAGIRRFCPSCGHPQASPQDDGSKKTCPACGTENPKTAKFCKSDGHLLDHDVPAMVTMPDLPPIDETAPHVWHESPSNDVGAGPEEDSVAELPTATDATEEQPGRFGGQDAPAVDDEATRRRRWPRKTVVTLAVAAVAVIVAGMVALQFGLRSKTEGHREIHGIKQGDKLRGGIAAEQNDSAVSGKGNEAAIRKNRESESPVTRVAKGTAASKNVNSAAVVSEAAHHQAREDLKEAAPISPLPAATVVEAFPEKAEISRAATPVSKKASLDIASTPPGAVVFMDERHQGVTPLQIVDVQPGRHRLRLSAPDSLDLTRDVTLKAGERGIVDVPLIPAMGSLSLTTGGVVANLFLDDGRFVGTSPLVRFPVAAGSHQVFAKASGYRDHNAVVRVEKGQDVLREVLLERTAVSPGLLSVITEPPDAEVYLDASPLGHSPIEGRQVTPGRHVVEVRKPSYERQEREFTIVSDEREMAKFSLARAASQLSISSRPTGSVVILDGIKVGVTPLALSPVDPGSHMLELKQARYLAARRQVQVNPGEKTSIHVDHEPEPASLSIAVVEDGRPSWAEIRMNGTLVGNAPLVTKNLKPNTYGLEVRRAGYSTLRQDVVIAPGEEKRLVLTLVRGAE